MIAPRLLRQGAAWGEEEGALPAALIRNAAENGAITMEELQVPERPYLPKQRSSSSLSSASQGSPSTKSRAGHQYSKKKLKGDTKLDTRLLRRVRISIGQFPRCSARTACAGLFSWCLA